MENDLPATFVKGFHDENVVKKIRYNVLGGTGLRVSHLGFGAAQLAHCYGKYNEPQGIDTVIQAVKNGINYIDTAPFYGDTTAEIVLGKALSRIPREAYYVATKVGRYSHEIPTMFDFSAERSKQSVEESLQRLGLDYIDIIQVHDIEFAPNLEMVIKETLPALEKIRDSGRAKFIGITGYPIHTLKEVLDKSSVKIDVVLSYCRCTLFDCTMHKYIPHFKRKNVGIINAAIVGMGLLTNAGPPLWHPATAEVKDVCYNAVQYCKEQNVNIAKLAVVYSLSQAGIDTHLIGMSSLAELKENLDAFLNGLTIKEKDMLEEIEQRFFKNLTERHWENIELQKYWQQIKDNEK